MKLKLFRLQFHQSKVLAKLLSRSVVLVFEYKLTFVRGGEGEIRRASPLHLQNIVALRTARPHCSLFCHSLMLASSATGSARNAPSRTYGSQVRIMNYINKKQSKKALFFLSVGYKKDIFGGVLTGFELCRNLF